jgi:hypothetical protein
VRIGQGYGLGVPIEEKNGRVFWAGEDWGPVVERGGISPCCGCTWQPGDNRGDAKICATCKCHALYRQIHHLTS